MKKTLAGIDDLIHLVEQWTSSIKMAEGCIIQLDDYKIDKIQIGVITENNDVQRRKRELKSILHPEIVSEDKLPSFIISQQIVNGTIFPLSQRISFPHL